MKKLKLKALELGAKELFTRDQLKNVLGGGYAPLGCPTPCSTGTGSIKNNTWKVTQSTCSLNTVTNADGSTLSWCGCNGAGEIVTGCSAPK